MTTLSDFNEALSSLSGPKFKVGDRVRVVRAELWDHVDRGQTGTVCENSRTPWIRFDKRTRYNVSLPEFGIPAGFGDSLHENQLELVAESPAPDINSIATELVLTVEANATASDQRHATVLESIAKLLEAIDTAQAELRAMRGGK